MPRTLALIALPTALAAWGVACGFPERGESWRDQLKPDSPCYEVDLLDGLDGSSSTELDALFSCVNRNGHIEPLQPLTRAFDEPTRAGRRVSAELVEVIEALPDADIDPFGLAGLAVDALRADDRPIEPLLDWVLELLYAEPAADVRTGVVAIDSPTALQRGVLTRSAPVWTAAATALLDDPGDARAWAADLLASHETKRWVRTLDHLGRSTDNRVSQPARRLLGDLGGALLAVQSPTNNRWEGAGDNSLHDLLSVATTGAVPLLDLLADDVHLVLSDRIVRRELPRSLVRLHRDGHLTELGVQVAWMASVDREGRSLQSDEISALAAFLRMLRDANRPMRCSLDLWVTNVDVDLGNLAVAILELVAEQEATFVADASFVLSEVMGWGLSSLVLDEIAESGVCPALTPRLLADLGALEVLYQPEAQDLLAVFLDVLQVLKHGQDNHIPLLADAVTDLVDVGAVDPLQEGLRDLGAEPVLVDVFDLLPVLVDPGAHGLPEDGSVADFDAALDLIDALFDRPAGSPGFGWHRFEPLLVALLDDPALWSTVDALGRLLANERSALGHALPVLPRIIALDPELQSLDTLAALIREPAIADPLLRVVEQGTLVHELLTPRPTGTDLRSPQSFLAQIVVDGTLDELLRLVDLTLSALDALQSPTEP
jgi:hypothetical protein